MTRQSSLTHVLLPLLFISTVLAYGLEGSWQVDEARNTQPGLTKAVTLLFEVSAKEGSISHTLFVYDCFISQYRYKVEDQDLVISFQKSSVFSPECSIAVITAIRQAMKTVISFRINYDRLTLLNLKGGAVFALKRQKLDYGAVLVGEWQVQQGGRRASSRVRINQTHGFMCGDSLGMAYSIVTLINGSYPSFRSRITRQEPCPDVGVLEDMVNSAFLLVSANLTQVTMYNYQGKALLVLDLIKAIKGNAKIAAQRQPPRQTVNPRSTSSQSIGTQSSQSTSQSRNSQQSTPNPPSTSSSNLQGSSGQGSNQVVVNPPPTQPRTVSVPQTVITMEPPPTESMTQPPATTPVPNIAPQTQPQSSSFGSFFFDLSDNSPFGGSFSSQPTPVDEPVPVTQPVTQASQPEPMPTAPIIMIEPATPQPASQPFTFDFSLNEDFFSAFGTFQSQPQASSFTFSSQQPSQTEQLVTVIEPITTNEVSSSFARSGSLIGGNSRSMGVNAVLSRAEFGVNMPLGQYIQQDKWFVEWINGYDAIPTALSRTYLIFTDSKIILYCPCNTYYTNYSLDGNQLVGVEWLGTSNRCSRNRDRQITNFLFYANTIQTDRSTDTLSFYFNTQAKLIEFALHF